FLIEGNGITNFSGLEALEYVGNNITLVNNPNLVSTEGLSGLTYTKYLSIGYNESLVSLNGLGSLEIVDNDLDVYNNPNLISLTGLYIANVSTLINLTLTDNAMLSDCTLPWVCDYIQERIGNIHGNAPGCGSGLEIRQICLVDTEEENETLNSTVF